MALQFTTSYIDDSLALFRQYKNLAERAMEQISDEQLFTSLDPETNSIAIIVKHLSGNMRSRWTDSLPRTEKSRTAIVTENSLIRLQPGKRFWKHGMKGGHASLRRWSHFRRPTWCAR
jgi:Protein of unknown function (DUF1572)